MKSNVCKIENGIKDLEAIFRESEKVAVYNELTHKQALQLRLICEEIDGMLPKIVDGFDGDLWIEFEKGVCKVNVSIAFDHITGSKREELIKVAKNQKNAAAVGIAGKIRAAIENFFLDEENICALESSADMFHMATGFSDGVDYSYLWSLEQYRSNVAKGDKPENQDELEKSVIASVADDVVIGIKGKQADIVITKRFA